MVWNACKVLVIMEHRERQGRNSSTVVTYYVSVLLIAGVERHVGSGTVRDLGSVFLVQWL